MTSIRQATLADAAALARVHVLGWQHGYRGLLPQHVLDGLDPQDRLPRWTATIGDSDWPARGVLVAVGGDTLLGFASISASADDRAGHGTGEIRSFYVLPTAWGRGVGALLMAEAIDTLRAAGCTAVTLWVLSTNARAIGFYEHLGWVADGATKPDDVGGMPITDLRYRRELS